MDPRLLSGAMAAGAVLVGLVALALLLVWLACFADLLWMAALRRRLTAFWLIGVTLVIALAVGSTGKGALTLAVVLLAAPILCRVLIDWDSWRRDDEEARGTWRDHVFRRAERENKQNYTAPPILAEE